MTRLLRGAWSRRGTLVSLVAMVLVVTAGAVTVTRFSDEAATSPWLALPLYLLGAVAVAECGRSLASRRREEVGLHRLRGVRGARLLGALLAEPLLAVLLGLVGGLAVGGLVTVLATRAWLGRAADPLDAAAVGVAVLVALGGLASAAVGQAGGLREPLAAQVSTAERPRRATTASVFLGLLAVVGAVVACYRAGRTVGDPDAVVALGPALVALAAGLLTGWLVRLVARALSARTTGSGLAPFLAVRRLGRSADGAGPVRLLVAAAVLAALTVSGALAVSGWVDDSARIAVGGPTFVPVGGGALTALGAARSLDPEGTHLMAVAAATDQPDAEDRRAFVDAARYDAVVGDHLAGTPAAGAAVDRLTTGEEPRLLTGDVLELAVTRMDRPTGRGGVRVTVDYVDDTSSTSTVEAELHDRPGAGSRRVRLPVAHCLRACVLRSLTVEAVSLVEPQELGAPPGPATWQAFPDPRLEVLVTRLRLGDDDLLDQAFVPAAGLDAPPFDPVVVNRPDGLEVHGLADGVPVLVPEVGSGVLPALATASARAAEVVRTPGGRDRPVDLRGTVAGLPFVAADGLLSDLPSALVGDDPTATGVEVGVVAAADTPASMLASLRELADAPVRTTAAAVRATYDVSGAQQARVDLLVAGACLLVALVALATAVARQRAEHRTQVAALRVVGIGTGTARRAGRLELGLLAVLTAAGVAAGAWVAGRFLLAHLHLVEVPPHGVPVGTSVPWLPVVGAALLAGLAVLLVGSRARDVPDALTRPGTLRDRTGAGVVA